MSRSGGYKCMWCPWLWVGGTCTLCPPPGSDAPASLPPASTLLPTHIPKSAKEHILRNQRTVEKWQVLQAFLVQTRPVRNIRGVPTIGSAWNLWIVSHLTVVETTTTPTTTTTVLFEEVDEYLSRLNTLLELMYAASELSDTDTDDHYHKGLRRVRRSAAQRRHRRSSMQRAKQVARKCCTGCSYADIQSLCWFYDSLHHLAARLNLCTFVSYVYCGNYRHRFVTPCYTDAHLLNIVYI